MIDHRGRNAAGGLLLAALILAVGLVLYAQPWQQPSQVAVDDRSEYIVLMDGGPSDDGDPIILAAVVKCDQQPFNWHDIKLYCDPATARVVQTDLATALHYAQDGGWQGHRWDGPYVVPSGEAPPTIPPPTEAPTSG